MLGKNAQAADDYVAFVVKKICDCQISQKQSDGQPDLGRREAPRMGATPSSPGIGGLKARERQPPGCLERGAAVTCVSFSWDGLRLAAGDANGSCVVVDVAHRRPGGKACP